MGLGVVRVPCDGVHLIFNPGNCKGNLMYIIEKRKSHKGVESYAVINPDGNVCNGQYYALEDLAQAEKKAEMMNLLFVKKEVLSLCDDH